MNYKDKLILVTGGSGFLGTELTKRLLEKGARVRCVARNEAKLLELKKKYPEVEIIPGDITDQVSVAQMCKGVEGIFHSGASKIVSMAEQFTIETTKTNVLGSLNLLERTLKENIEFFTAISTDKVAQIRGFYAASKYLMEGCVEQYKTIQPNTAFYYFRWGNILGSTNSVVPNWIQAIKEGKDIYLHSPTGTRFWMTVEGAADFMFASMENPPENGPQVPKDIKGMSIGNLLEAVIQKYDPKRKTKVIAGSLFDADNLHEKLLSDGKNSSEVNQFSIEEMKSLI